MRILTVDEMRALEAAADAAGHTYRAMMAQAGAGLTRAIRQQMDVRDKRVVVLVGPGNNGGDGLVAARLLQQNGAQMAAYLSRARDAATDPEFAAARDAEVDLYLAEEDVDHQVLRALVCQADVIVDALLGTGARPPLQGTIEGIVEAVGVCLRELPVRPLTYLRRGTTRRRARPLIVAVDGPSGMDFDSGEIDERALSANLTVTFGMPKWGHIAMPAAATVGELVVADIGIPPAVDVPAGPHLVAPDSVQPLLPARPIDANKGTFGKALIVAGSANYTGAAVLSARAAVRAGTGLVTCAAPAQLHHSVVPSVPEATHLLLPHTLGIINGHAVAVVREHATRYAAMLIGPGLGTASETRTFLTQLLLGNRVRSTGFVHTTQAAAPAELPPLVIDADGLNILARTTEWPAALPQETILTPHPGEMARLTGLAIEEIQADRLATAQTWADRWEHIVVLKGAYTVIAAPGRQPAILPFANPGLASAGTGDVLAGIIVALRAQGLGAFQAAVAGCYVHGLAGEIATAEHGVAGVAASDVAAAIGAALVRLSA